MGDRLATIDMGQKVGAAVPLFAGRGSWVPSNTMWPGPGAYLHSKFHLDPSNSLATVHQRRRQTGQDRQDSGPIALGEPFHKRSPKDTAQNSSISSDELIFTARRHANAEYAVVMYLSVTSRSICAMMRPFVKLL